MDERLKSVQVPYHVLSVLRLCYRLSFSCRSAGKRWKKKSGYVIFAIDPKQKGEETGLHFSLSARWPLTVQPDLTHGFLSVPCGPLRIEISNRNQREYMGRTHWCARFHISTIHYFKRKNYPSIWGITLSKQLSLFSNNKFIITLNL